MISDHLLAERLEVILAFIYEMDAHAHREDRLLYRWADEHLSESDRFALLEELEGAVKAPPRTETT